MAAADAVDKGRHKHAQHELGDAIAQEDAQQARAVLGRDGRKRQGEQREDHPSRCERGGGYGNQYNTQFIDTPIQDETVILEHFIGDVYIYPIHRPGQQDRCQRHDQWGEPEAHLQAIPGETGCDSSFCASFSYGTYFWHFISPNQSTQTLAQQEHA